MTSLIRTSTALEATVSLRPLRMTDRLLVRRWMADRAVIDFTVVVPGPEYGPVEPYDAASADRYLQVLVTERERRSFAIVDDDEHVGNVGLKAIDFENKRSECFIEIGERRARRRGVASKAMSLLLDIAFDELRLQEVRLGVFDFNHPAIALYRRVGFDEVSPIGNHYVDGVYFVINGMRITARQWAARRTVLH